MAPFSFCEMLKRSSGKSELELFMQLLSAGAEILKIILFQPL
jgi:hypothetical protein